MNNKKNLTEKILDITRRGTLQIFLPLLLVSGIACQKSDNKASLTDNAVETYNLPLPVDSSIVSKYRPFDQLPTQDEEANMKKAYEEYQMGVKVVVNVFSEYVGKGKIKYQDYSQLKYEVKFARQKFDFAKSLIKKYDVPESEKTVAEDLIGNKNEFIGKIKGLEFPQDVANLEKLLKNEKNFKKVMESKYKVNVDLDNKWYGDSPPY